MALTLAAFAPAYYSRHESVQKMLIILIVANATTHATIYTPNETLYFAGMDLLICVYAWWMWFWNRDEVSIGIGMISVCQLVLHAGWANTGIGYYVAYNVMYVAQLALIYRYGQIYGRAARQDLEGRRDDPFYRIVGPVLIVWKARKN